MELLGRRRPKILHYWESCREARPERFTREAAAQVGHRETSLPELFDTLTEAVETTTLQRGIGRWAG